MDGKGDEGEERESYDPFVIRCLVDIDHESFDENFYLDNYFLKTRLFLKRLYTPQSSSFGKCKFKTDIYELASRVSFHKFPKRSIYAPVFYNTNFTQFYIIAEFHLACIYIQLTT